MRTIEVFSLVGKYQKQIACMWFINDKDYQDIATRITTGAPCNSLRYDRFHVILIRLTYQTGFEMEYYTDHITEKMWKIYEEYMQLYQCAQELAKKRAWLHAWDYATPTWRQKATLRQMRRASRLLLKDQ